MEGRFLGLPAIAVSLVSTDHKGRALRHRSAGRAGADAATAGRSPPADTILNVNVPDRPWHELRGFAVTRLGRRHRAAPCIRQNDPRGRPVYWIGLPGDAEDDGPGTDSTPRGAASPSRRSIVDLTRYQALDKVAGWWRRCRATSITRRDGMAMSVFSRFGSEAKGLGMTSQRARDRLVDGLQREGGIVDRRVLDVLRELPRHLFIDEALATRAYENTALPIGHGQTISQPWVVARMTEAPLQGGVPRRVLEVGTGSGYQAAVLARLVEHVYTVERIEELLRNARRRFRKLGLENVRPGTTTAAWAGLRRRLSTPSC